MARDEIEVLVDLARGDAKAAVYTSDLSHDDVSIDADYRSWTLIWITGYSVFD